MAKRFGRLIPGLLLITFALATFASPSSHDRRIAITVDDLPVGPPNRHTTDQQIDITGRLLDVLEAHHAPAVGFVNESRLVVDGRIDSRRVGLLEDWLDRGQELGNHGYDHLDLHAVDTEDWLNDVLKGEVVTRKLAETRELPFRYFRHPYLHTGRSAATLRRTNEFFAEHGYQVAPVTIDNGEWIYANAYADAWNRGDETSMKRLGEDYVRYMLDVVDYYEDQSLRITGELIPQVLLIHAYALNADWLGSILDELEAKGYEWITLQEALAHPAYRRASDGYTGPSGITWLHRWAMTAGMDSTTFGDEPLVPEWVRDFRQNHPEPVKEPEPRALVVDRAEIRDLKSAINGVDYEIRISLPHGYEGSERRFPVVYLLDADYSFLIARNITDHLSERKHLNEVIVVGIGYPAQEGRGSKYRVNRTRDYTPVHVDDGGYGPAIQKFSGGGERFLDVIEKEVIPLIDDHYRTRRGDRTLVGHSYGGLFAIFAMFSRPGLFSGYVVVSPSLWYGGHYLFHREEEFASDNDSLAAEVYLCVGEREHNSDIDMVGDLESFVERLRMRNYEGLSFESRVMEDETHNSLFPGCLSNGLRYVLAGM